MKMNRNKIIAWVFVAALAVPTVTYPLISPLLDNENHENRSYSEFPELSAEEFASYSSDLEAYYNDRLPYKNQLVNLNSQIKVDLNLESNWMDYIGGMGVILGKEDWLFYNGNTLESSINDYVCNNLYTEAELQEIAGRYEALNEQYQAQGIEFVLFIPTNKEQVYPEYMPDEIVPQGDVSRTDQLVEYLTEHTEVPVIYTKEAMLEEKDNYQLFYKYDTHWNVLGGFVGAQLLREYLQGEKDTLAEHEVEQIDVASPRDLADVYGLGEQYSEPKAWVVADYKEDVQAQLVSDSGGDEDASYQVYESNAPDQRTLLMIKDSFYFSMVSTLSRDFARTAYISDTETVREFIEEEHPDIVVLEIVERQFHRMENQCLELIE